ncbi:hypothetical protein F5Y14DRAFT_264322 [Nemania sp. NC0429]|nr:hypothetical protein F5Y14DRAFT_264322 [Nemania sp. NC0429]
MSFSSQPILPSEKSRYFRNGMGDHQVVRDRSRLSPLPRRLSRSAAVAASPRTTSPRGFMPPLRARQQPHPFFSRGPAAMGYIPQQPLRYSRHPNQQEPIVPLRDEFSAVSNTHHHSDRSMAWQALAQPRPYSVPAHPMHISRTGMEHSAQAIPRPTSVAHTSTRGLHDLSRLASNPQLARDEEKVAPSSKKRDFPDNLGWEDELFPPKRILPFPISKQAKVQTAKTVQGSETLVPESQPSDILPNSAETALSTPPNDVSLDIGEATKRRTRIKLVSRSAMNESKPSAAQEYNPFTPISTQADEDPSQEPGPSQMSEDKSQGYHDGIIGNLDPMISGAEGIATPTDSTQAQESFQQSEAESIFIVPSSIPEDSYLELIDPSILSQHDRSSEPAILQQSSFTATATTTSDKPPHVDPNIPAPTCRTAPTRSASQATTVSTVSTEPPCAAENRDEPQADDASNPMSMIDEKMVLERDISDIVTARLREGNGTVASLEAFHAEILIKMAVRDGDGDVFSAVCSLLSS